MSKLGDLPEGVASVMFLRDGWPHACVCKVVTKDGCVGIGLYRHAIMDGPPAPEKFDQRALREALRYVALEPPDYTEIQEHVRQMHAAAAGGESLLHDEEETDEDLQAALGQKAYD
jgi:hypothetical protein